MASCAFFGHRICYSTIKEKLKYEIQRLIEKEDVNVSYVGNQGDFDKITYNLLISLKNTNPAIKIFVVLPYIPIVMDNSIDYCYTILPEGIENVPKRFAISFCNKWMVGKADFIISYVEHDWGGAAKFSNMAKRKGKKVINIAEIFSKTEE